MAILVLNANKSAPRNKFERYFFLVKNKKYRLKINPLKAPKAPKKNNISLPKLISKFVMPEADN